MDLKPANMLYMDVPDGQGSFQRVLKVIDFGGSEFIPNEHNALGGGAEKRANVCKLRRVNWGTPLYESPEQICPQNGLTKMYKVGVCFFFLNFLY